MRLKGFISFARLAAQFSQLLKTCVSLLKYRICICIILLQINREQKNQLCKDD